MWTRATQTNIENLKIIFLRHHSVFYVINKYLLCVLHYAIYAPVKILIQQSGWQGEGRLLYYIHFKPLAGARPDDGRWWGRGKLEWGQEKMRL